MVASNFAPSLACVLVHEGGKDDDPNDPGGRTAYGVIQRRYNQYRKAKGLPVRDVWDITPAEREEIYKVYYWDVCRAADLPADLDYCVFDACVNSGDAQSAFGLEPGGQIADRPADTAPVRALSSAGTEHDRVA